MNKQIFTLFVILYSFIQAFAQQFPITVIPQFNPPAPVNFHNYADGSTINSPLRIQLLLNDITVTNRQIRLKLSFEGNGINFENRNVVVGASQLLINGGEPLTLNNVELAPYFEFQNIQGINPNVYAQTIPEGSYQFCFEVFDVITGNRLASKTCITTYIFKNEPPLLNLPYHRSNIEPQPTDNIVFQWTPRHINVSNVEYELSIVEIWDDTVDPQTAFLSLPPIFETTTRATSFLYGPTQPLLLPNKRYAWRIRAKALQGAEEIGLFRNEGKSEIFWFSRTEPCEVPINVYAEPKGISKINVFWDEDPSIYSEYTIAYREAEKPNAHWFTMRTNSGWATVWDLKPGTTYEYKVKGKCKFQYGSYSEVQEVTTDTTQDESANYNCGIVPDAIAINNREPHPGLSISDRITAGDFVVTIVEIDNQSNGRITGRGYVGIPYFNYARFGVKFNNILVNTDKQLAEGEMVTLYDPEFGEGETMTVDLDIDPIGDIYGDDGEVDNTVEVDFVVVEVTTDENGAIIVVGDEGEEEIFAGGQDVVIVDNNGVTWTVGDDDTVTVQEEAVGGPATDDNTEGINEGEVSELTATGVRIDFIDSGYHSYDMLPASITDTKFVENYDTLSASGEQHYIVPYKAVSDTGAKKEDIITAKATFYDTTISTNDIVFKTKEGIKINAIWDKDVATLSLKRKSSFLIEEILATVKPKEEGGKFTIAGAFKLNHLGNKEVANIDVVIVAVNDAKVNTDLNSKINDIYNKAGVNFNVTSGSPLQIPENIWDVDIENGKIDVGDSGLLHYSPEERAIKNYYINSISDYNDKAYYIFVTDIPTSKEGTVGFMPLKGQFGFAFSPSDQARAIAHELGHGVFGLSHPFDEYGIPKKSTDLLMDYKGGTALNHMEWKKMHAPGLELYLFQDDEEGEYNDSGFADKVFQIIQCAYLNSETDRITFDTGVFGKTGKFFFKWKGNYMGIWIENGSFEGNPVYEPVILKANAHKRNLPWRFSLLYKNLEIYTPRYDSGADPNTLNELRKYLFPEDKSQLKEEADKILSEIFAKDEFIEEDFEKIRSIANCGAQYFTAKDRYTIISKTIKYLDREGKWVTEYYEDLFLDLIETAPLGDPISYSDEFLTYLLEDIDVFKKLFMQLSDDTAGNLWVGNEDNFTRFIGAIYKLWAGSKYDNENTFPYVEQVEDYASQLTPYWIHYNGKSWFPSVSYEDPVFGSDSFTMIQKKGSKIIANLKFDYFQPVQVTFEGDSGSKVTKKMPAIFFGGTIKKDNLEKSLDQAGLVFDVALTLTAVGNFTKLRHLSTLHKVTRVTMGTVDITNSFLNIMVKYGDLEYCQKNKEFCKSFQQYSMYLQLGLMGGGIIDSKIVASRIEAKEAYLASKSKLDADEVKVLDEHFLINAPSGNWFDNLPDLLKKDLADNKVLDDLFRGASNFQREGLYEAWKVLEDFPEIRVSGDNLEVLSTISVRFRYGGEEAYKGLTKLLAEGSSASKQKLIDGFKEVDKIFDISLPVTFSGIKKGEVTVQFNPKAIDGTGDEIARYVDGVLQKKKIIEEADVPGYEIVGRHDGNDILRNGDAVGFRVADIGGSFAKLTTKSSLSTSLFNQLDNVLASAPSIKFNYGSKALQSPKQFLNATGNDMYDIVLSNGRYAKFDNATGRLLYFEDGDKFFVRYADDGVNVSNVESFIKGKVNQLKNCTGLNGSQTVNLISEVGGPITTNTSKVTTFVGKVTETQLLKDQFGNFKHIEVGEMAGSVNLLNMPDTYFNGTTWWVDHNKAWIERAISRGDDIYIASPLKNIDMNIDNILVTQQYGPSYYARELNELVKIDYKPINLTPSEWAEVKNLINSIFD